MNQPRAFLNGEYINPAQLTIPVTDGGFVQGLTVAEQLRTFGGKLFRVQEHLARLMRSLDIVGVDPGFSANQLLDMATELVRHNHALLEPGDDLGLSIFVTPGPYSTFGVSGGPLVGMHTYPLPFQGWAEKYRTGQAMIITDVRQVPISCWPAELKCRSRMHYHLADREARERDRDARALLLDQQGWVSEASTANVFAFFDQVGLVSPPQDQILPGISVAFVRQLAHELGLAFVDRPMRPEELFRAEELFLCSTSPCILPVTRLNHHPIGTGVPGPVFQQLMVAWSRHVGLDVREQAERFRVRPTIKS